MSNTQSTEKFSPLISEFETQTQAENYDVWFKAKLQKAIESKKPRIPHDLALAKVQALLKTKRDSRAVAGLNNLEVYT